MTSLSDREKQLLFDYCLGLTSEQETIEAESLIASNEQAAAIHSKLKSAVAPLECVSPEACPEALAERTIMRLKAAADTGREHLEQLLATEQARKSTIKLLGFRGNWGEVVAIAAILMIITAIGIPSLGFARQKYWQHRCQVQLGSIFQGLANYVSDHDEQLPAVAATAGEPWWKVGYQGRENHSNTRPVWLLVKRGYVKPEKFVCPGRRQTKKLQFDLLRVEDYHDFPSRAYVSISFRLRCKEDKRDLSGRKVMMADLNPLLEELPTDYSRPLRLRVCEEMLKSNSYNHNRRGQNVMFSDGSIVFARARYVGEQQDDIFTLRDMSCGSEVKGCERPSCVTDTFLAP